MTCLKAVCGMAVAAALLGAPARADVQIEDFSNFNLSGTFASWDTATITSGADDYRIQFLNFGGGFFDINPDVDGTGETEIELIVSVNDGSTEGGVLAVLADSDGTELVFSWFGLVPGDYVLTRELASGNPGAPGADGVFNQSSIGFFQLQGDFVAGDLTFDNLALTPEPASAVAVLLGALALLRRR